MSRILQQPCGDGGRYRVYGKVYGGLWHTGKDFDVPLDTEVRPVEDGIVNFAWLDLPGFGGLNPVKNGPCILINHGDWYGYYGHITPKVKAGDKVTKDTIIGTVSKFTNGVDENGNEIECDHLHLSVWDGKDPAMSKMGYRPVGTDGSVDMGRFVDPVKFLSSNGVERVQFKLN